MEGGRNAEEAISKPNRSSDIYERRKWSWPRARQREGSVGSWELREQTYYRWRKEYGSLRVDQVRRLKELERENGRLKKLVADQALDLAILKETSSGNF